MINPAKYNINNFKVCVNGNKVSPLVPISPKDLKDKRLIISPLVPPPIQGTKDLTQNNHFPYNYPLEVLRRELLQTLRQKQPFRVSIGKGTWIDYENFSSDYNLREILNDEIVIEFDCEPEISGEAIMGTLFNLTINGIVSELWDHGGRSSHIHIRNLPIKKLDIEQRRLFKKVFIRKFVPLEYLQYVDLSLTGTHLVRIEWSSCWKNKYGIKKLVNIYDPINDEIYKKNIQELKKEGITGWN